jgi:alkanesulfonate monooxygenase SsuD/methylene tetrahydromethanopterin reductase-like flavin-dependent oxidoreductase (luciferase family)
MKRGAVPWRRIRYKYLRPASVWAEPNHSLRSAFARPSSESCLGLPRRVGDTAEEARRKRALLDSLVHPDSGIASLSIALGCDASVFDLDGPLPEIPESNASKSGRERVIERARRDNLTVRQLAQIAGSYGGLALVGTPGMVADQMEEWLYSDACDGFNIMFPWVPGGLDDFVDRVVPELQRRNLFRREYEGRTLRENLGLPRPQKTN